ncbi:MAG: M6 family metalloprotease domain-containing protein [Verrucomicrobia bacterium]|nr:MAG: M6 family metalloprotease domain-containing protein [Verrucomicrobiota bacterium]
MKKSCQISPAARECVLLPLDYALRRTSNWTWDWPGIGRKTPFTRCRMSPPDTSHLLHLGVGLVVALVQLSFAPMARAIIASPHPVKLSQPDGRTITLRIRGDEHLNWHEDMNGFTVLCHNGRYVYANRDVRGALTPTKLEVGIADPNALGLTKGLLPARQVTEPEQQRVEVNQAAPTAVAPGGGTLKNLVVLCRFNDHTPGVHTRPKSDYDVLFNRIGGDPILAPSGSVRDFYKEISYGLITIESTVVAWVTLPNSEAYYANQQNGFGSYPQNAQRMVEDALDLVDPLVDLGKFDANNDGKIDCITIIHSGYGAEWGAGGGNCIWSHKWFLPTPWTSTHRNANGMNVTVSGYHTEPALWETSGTSITRIGVICHEIGHAFGLPDLYDTDHSSSGIGSYCLMANSWGFDGTQLHPPHMSAWCKVKLGWVVPTIIGPASYDAPQVETSPAVFRIENGYPSGEYLLIENRQATGFENDMPQGGLAIWHIDENKPNNDNTEGYPGQRGWPRNGNHYKIALLQADGQYDLEYGANRGDSGDLYQGNGVSLIGADTTPNTDSYQSGNVRRTGNIISSISSSGSVMTFVFSAASLAPLRLWSPHRMADGTCRIWIGTADGTAIDPARIPAIDVYTSTNVAQPMAGWTRLTGSLVATNGLAWIDDPVARILPMRFYRASENLGAR